ncbi:hypothetical protein AOLI_G00251220 [Acnodon oligacanthus]
MRRADGPAADRRPGRGLEVIPGSRLARFLSQNNKHCSRVHDKAAILRLEHCCWTVHTGSSEKYSFVKYPSGCCASAAVELLTKPELKFCLNRNPQAALYPDVVYCES